MASDIYILFGKLIKKVVNIKMINSIVRFNDCDEYYMSILSLIVKCGNVLLYKI